MIKTYKDLKDRIWDKSGIPKWIFRTGNDSLENLHPEIAQIYNTQLENNPGYELFYFSKEDRVEFIKDFNIETTYDKLIPIAFKADLFKFAITYAYGGVCMDFSMESLIPLDDILKDYTEVLAKDTDAPDGLCVGFYGSIKGNTLLQTAIEKCIHNTTYNLYGVHPLDVTGPLMFAGVYKKLNEVDVIPVGKITDDCYLYDMADQIYIYDGDLPIIKIRTDNHYSILYNNKKDNLYYGNLWHENQVYARKLNTYKDLKGRKWEIGGIPKWIFKTGPFDLENLPEVYKHIYLDMLNKNATYELFYFSDADCRAYISDEYGEDYLKTYDDVLPTAYKADFWRYLILYKHGGCYGDFSQAMLVPFDYIIHDVERVVVVDTPEASDALYNAFMCNKPGDLVVKEAIDLTKHNIDNRLYGINTLDVTGPRVFGRAYCNVVFNKRKAPINIGLHNGTKVLNNKEMHGNFIVDLDGKNLILKKLHNHFDVVYNNRGMKHYGQMWGEKIVFKPK